MPSAGASTCGRNGADIVLGDCHGRACAPEIVEAARSLLAKRGFAVAINTPYAGGFTTGHYGRPGARRHALQIEINRALYMDEQNYLRKACFSRLVDDMTDLIDRLGRVAQQCLREAAPGA
jgi:N-formylglutamate amidohydrolase